MRIEPRPAPLLTTATTLTTTTTTRSSLLAVLTLLLATLVSVTGIGIGAAPTAVANANDEQVFVDLINDLRHSRGLSTLTVDANMTDLARQHTGAMATNQRLVHTADLTAGVTTNWEKLGENIGFGSNIGLVWNAFVNSPEHFANLTDPAFNAVGVGVRVDANGIVWTTHRFVRIGAPPPPPFVPPTMPPTVPRPPAPRPAPTPAPVVPRSAATAPPTTAVAAPAPITALAPEPIKAPGPAPSPATPASVSSLLDALQVAG